MLPFFSTGNGRHGGEKNRVVTYPESYYVKEAELGTRKTQTEGYHEFHMRKLVIPCFTIKTKKLEKKLEHRSL